MTIIPQNKLKYNTVQQKSLKNLQKNLLTKVKYFWAVF